MQKNPEAHPAAEPIRRERASKKQTKPKPGPQSLSWRTFDPSSIDGNDLFREELATYKDHLAELLKHNGEYVLIKGPAVIDFFPTLEAALESAEERFGGEPALIKQVIEREPVHPASGLAL